MKPQLPRAFAAGLSPMQAEFVLGLAAITARTTMETLEKGGHGFDRARLMHMRAMGQALAISLFAGRGDRDTPQDVTKRLDEMVEIIRRDLMSALVNA